MRELVTRPSWTRSVGHGLGDWEPDLLGQDKDWVQRIGPLLPLLHKAHQVDEGLGGEWSLVFTGPAVQLKHLDNGHILIGVSQGYTGDVL